MSLLWRGQDQNLPCYYLTERSRPKMEQYLTFPKILKYIQFGFMTQTTGGFKSGSKSHGPHTSKEVYIVSDSLAGSLGNQLTNMSL